jgi:hypothetical protein
MRGALTEMINYDAAVCYGPQYKDCQVKLNQEKEHQVLYTSDNRRIDFWVKYDSGVLYISKIEVHGIFKNTPFVELSKNK